MLNKPAFVRKLDELGLSENNKTYDWYLSLLHFSGDTDSEFFSRFQKFAVAVKDDDRFISDLIRDRNWRATVVGVALGVVLRKFDLQADMIWRIANLNWAAPQLAAGIGFLDRGKGESQLVPLLNEATEDSNPKSVLSIYAALGFLGSPAAVEFENSELFAYLTEKDAWDNSVKIARRSWVAWKDVEPIQI